MTDVQKYIELKKTVGEWIEAKKKAFYAKCNSSTAPEEQLTLLTDAAEKEYKLMQVYEQMED